ncbi:unnamed protein product [Caenorhabditis bovis]|uniref:Receptor L-domain domain-containing protein n=1 Tax=Caenorhabditis bovis TaxID=2654633 RepID=A0A8S1E3P8_9PELO|nr:unnamed protein product [Caenorhabditis bovis]
MLNSESETVISLKLAGNKQLTSLGFYPKILGVAIYIEDNPKLCISPQGMIAITIPTQNTDKIFDVTICEDSETPENFCVNPKSGKLKDLKENCLYFFGDLVIDENFDFENSYKLNSIEVIYGRDPPTLEDQLKDETPLNIDVFRGLPQYYKLTENQNEFHSESVDTNGPNTGSGENKTKSVDAEKDYSINLSLQFPCLVFIFHLYL